MNVCIKVLEHSTNWIQNFAVFNGLLHFSDFKGDVTVLDNHENKVRTLSGHGIIRNMVVFEDKLYIYGKKNIADAGSFHIWDANGVLVQLLNANEVFNNHPASRYVKGIKFEIYEWDSNNVILPRLCDDFNNFVICYALFNDLLYSGHYDGTIYAWNKNGTLNHKLTGHTEHINDLLAFNDHLYSCCEDGSIRKWNSKGECIQVFNFHKIPLLRFIVYNNRIYVGDTCGNIIILGDYFQHHYSRLPAFQKSKLRNWRSGSRAASIHKDISFLFERELLL